MIRVIYGTIPIPSFPIFPYLSLSFPNKGALSLPLSYSLTLEPSLLELRLPTRATKKGIRSTVVVASLPGAVLHKAVVDPVVAEELVVE